MITNLYKIQNVVPVPVTHTSLTPSHNAQLRSLASSSCPNWHTRGQLCVSLQTFFSNGVFRTLALVLYVQSHLVAETKPWPCPYPPKPGLNLSIQIFQALLTQKLIHLAHQFVHQKHLKTLGQKRPLSFMMQASISFKPTGSST